MEPLAERLHHEADKRATLREKAKELLEAHEVMSHTFTPSINRSQSVGAIHTPIHLRAGEIQQKKEERMRAAVSEEEKQLEAAFQPQISSRSRRLAQQKRGKLERSPSAGGGEFHLSGPVEERLYREALLLEQRRAARQEELSQGSSAGPRVDEGSRRICQASVYFQGAQQDFLTRQRTFEAARQRRRDIRIQHASDKSAFTPKINVSSRQLVATNLDFLRSTPSDTTERLAVKDVGRRGQRQQDLVKLHYQDCTFKPALNRASRQMAARSPSVDSLAAGAVQASRPAAEGRSKSSADHEVDKCTFKPVVSPGTAKMFAHVRSHYTGHGAAIMDQVRQELERKSEQLAARRRELEERELAECTFAPGTSKPFEDRLEPVRVSGLDRFFELRDLAARRQQEQQRREEKLLSPDLSDARIGGLTIPVPFELSRAATVRGPQGAF